MTPDDIRAELAADDGYQWPDDGRIGTHFPGCWSHYRHHECAIRLLRAIADGPRQAPPTTVGEVMHRIAEREVADGEVRDTERYRVGGRGVRFVRMRDSVAEESLDGETWRPMRVAGSPDAGGAQ